MWGRAPSPVQRPERSEGERPCRGGRPVRPVGSERAFRRHNHNRQSSSDAGGGNPPARFQKDPAARITRKRAAPAFVPFEGWELRLQSRPAQTARNREPSSEGAQACSPPRKRWVDRRKEVQAPRGERKFVQENSQRWWAHQDLNLEPTDYESAALTVELWAREAGSSISRAEASVRVRQTSTDPEPWPLRTENDFNVPLLSPHPARCSNARAVR